MLLNRETLVVIKDPAGNVVYSGAIVLGNTYNLPCTDPLAVPSSPATAGFGFSHQAYALVWWTPMGISWPGMATPGITGGVPVTDVAFMGPKLSRANNAAVTPSVNPPDGSSVAAITTGYAGVALNACAAGGMVQCAGPGSIVAVLTSSVAIAKGAAIGSANGSGLCVVWSTTVGERLGTVIKQNVVAAPGSGSTSYAIALINPA